MTKTVKRPRESVKLDDPRIPGRVNTRKTHGLAKPVRTANTGAELLREALEVSGEVPIDQLCRDATATIERLSAGQEPAKLTNVLAKTG